MYDSLICFTTLDSLFNLALTHLLFHDITGIVTYFILFPYQVIVYIRIAMIKFDHVKYKSLQWFPYYFRVTRSGWWRSLLDLWVSYLTLSSSLCVPVIMAPAKVSKSTTHAQLPRWRCGNFDIIVCLTLTYGKQQTFTLKASSISTPSMDMH